MNLPALLPTVLPQAGYSNMGKKHLKQLSPQDIDRIIEMAWEDRTSFDAIQAQFGISEQEVITLMRREMKPSSWRMWRARVQGRATKHNAKRGQGVDRFRSSRQRDISHNRTT